MKTLLYLMYGNRPEYHRELTYSILSAVKFIGKDSPDIQIALVTTNENRRDDLPIRHLIVDESEMNRWMLGGKYTHAAKYEALVYAMDEFRGQVAYVDTDTFFIAHPEVLFERIGPGRTLMCDHDRTLGELGYWSDLLTKTAAPVAGYTVNASSVMFNAGVLGVDWSMRSRIEDVYDLMAELFAIEPVFNVEQFAFSAVLNTHASLSVCPDVVRHYWGFDRRFVHAELEVMFPSFSKEIFEQNLHQVRALGMPEKPILARLRARALRVFRANNRHYSFAYLSYLCALSRNREGVADVWANTALDALTSRAVNWDKDDLTHVKRDFRDFLPERLDGHSWMKPVTRERWRQYWAD